MTDLELLNFITEYLSVQIPLKIDEKKFLELVNVGIKNDERESLWRLALNYSGKCFDYSDIMNYYIKQKGYYYITESISAFKEDLDMFDIYNKLFALNDKEFLVKILFVSYIIDTLSNEEIEFIINKNKENKLLNKKEIAKLKSYLK